jgi:hypothetical protein
MPILKLKDRSDNYVVLFSSTSFDLFCKAIMRQYDSKKIHPVHKLCHEKQCRSQLHWKMYNIYKIEAEIGENIQLKYKYRPSALQIV